MPTIRKMVSPASFRACFFGLVNVVLFSTIFFFFGGRGGNQKVDSSTSGVWPAGADRKLAVVVPMFDGDADESFDAMRLWPTKCSPLTLRHTDLVIYHAEAADEALLRSVPKAASTCFRQTKVVNAHLTAEENVYPKGPSIQFYKLFLDTEVSKQLEMYDALAIIESDVTIAHDTSFERLYKAAFTTSEPFWMKGSTLDGAEFHEAAKIRAMWHVIGHINGNAIYNNSDPAFADFVNFTLHRWEYEFPYDVALWAAIADFPYTWPLWQRYSSKFVVTNLISNVGFYDVSESEVKGAVTADTLFIHGSDSRGGSKLNKDTGGVHLDFPRVKDTITRCTTACGTRPSGLPVGMSTTCDDTCWAHDNDEASRFDDHHCGAGDSTLFGDHCRLCYTDREAALRADRELAQQFSTTTEAEITGERYEGGGAETMRKHVIMCDTKRPPEALECTPKCAQKSNAVCDQRCGTSDYHNLHCNWRGYGKTCRFCFNDYLPARIASGIASARGSSVIMCDTHEPPGMRGSMLPFIDETVQNETPTSGSDGDDFILTDQARDTTEDDPREVVFTKNITRGDICVFVPGYLEFLTETNITVNSILGFMPGVRVSIATGIYDFHVYNRTIGKHPDVHVWNSSYVDFAALWADIGCGNGTMLIYYMSVGQVLSREFTSKDTHSPRGDLIVSYTEANKVGTQNALRAMATTLILGFHSPSFTYGTDLILPAGANAELRKVFLSASAQLIEDAAGSPTLAFKKHAPPTDELENLLRDYAVALASVHQLHTRIFVPELLAGLEYTRNAAGVVFQNPEQWTHHHVFKERSVWDIPLVKPHFSCLMDVGPSLQGSDVAEQLGKWMEGFRRGASCELGFHKVRKKHLNTKPHWEFGPLTSTDPTENERTKMERMPSLKNYNISVMFRSFVGDAALFNVSLPTVAKHFPDAKEVVVVVVESDGELFEEIVKPHQATAPFPIRVVTEPDIMDGHIQQKYSKLRGDVYCEGDFILHLDSDVVMFEPLTYDHIFHWGKPVLPFRRYREEIDSGQRTLEACWRKGTSFAVGEEVVHEFSIFNTHVYPRKMYPAIRVFIEQRHGLPFEDFMASRRGKCMHWKTLAKWTLEEQTLLLSDFNLMGAYLWYHMHDEMHWMATDPYDMQVNEWRRDVTKYAWVCQANGRYLPEDKPGAEQYISGLLSIENLSECVHFEKFWEREIMKNPETREPNPPRFQEEH